ncbi:DUF3923 family protein [Streptococcus dentiloxodontae]
MNSVKKRLAIGINIACLLAFLDGTLLIYLRSVNSAGRFQSPEEKWLSFLILSFIYAAFFTAQGVFYCIYKHHKKKAQKQVTRFV